MSRAYRIRVSESLHTVVKAEDHVKTQLEILEILPCDETAELLKAALEDLGFEEGEDGMMVREKDGIVVEVDPTNAIVTVRTESEESLDLTTEREGSAWDDVGDSRKTVEKKLRESAQQDLEAEAKSRESSLQEQLTDRLEEELGDIRDELASAVNQVTREALRRKASRIGQIKEISEDGESGGMTIVVEV